LDCNGFSPISKNVKPYMACTDLHGANGGRFHDNGWYIGHDEPSIQFFSNARNSGNNMAWEITLPKQDPTPTQSGSSVATFELTPTFWLSLALCDPQSYPQNAVHAGQRFEYREPTANGCGFSGIGTPILPSWLGTSNQLHWPRRALDAVVRCSQH
jgi:hypothetical protein